MAIDKTCPKCGRGFQGDLCTACFQEAMVPAHVRLDEIEASLDRVLQAKQEPKPVPNSPKRSVPKYRVMVHGPDGVEVAAVVSSHEEAIVLSLQIQERGTTRHESSCSVCRGRGKTMATFEPTAIQPCLSCQGTGFVKTSWAPAVSIEVDRGP